MQSAVEQAADWITCHAVNPLLAVDATAGNGHDTLFLAGRVGPSGRVYAIDIQPDALAETRRRLKEAGVLERVILVEGDHANLPTLLPGDCSGQVDCIMFNLGYLPGGDKRRVTHRESTRAALTAARRVLRPGSGCMTVVAYCGHPEGADETAAVRAWFEQQLDAGDTIWEGQVPADRKDPPRAFGLQKGASPARAGQSR